MELMRIKLLLGGLIFQLLFAIVLPLPYNKYGRQCSDIGCLSNQVCVMAYDSCSLGQREGNECGRFPTCKKSTEAGLAAGPSDTASTVNNDRPNPPPNAPGSSDMDVLSSLGLNPDAPPAGNSGRPASGGQNPYHNPYPSLPTQPQPHVPNRPQPPQPQPAPHYPPASGGQYYYGGGGGGAGTGGGSSSNNRGQFDATGGNIIVPTPKPSSTSSSGGGFFSGILGGIQNAVSNAVKQQVGTYINQRLGLGPAAGTAGAGGQAAGGGLGGLFDARNLIDSKSFGGLFSERKPPAEQQRAQSTYAAQYAAAPVPSASSTAAGRETNSGQAPAYGWKLD